MVHDIQIQRRPGALRVFQPGISGLRPAVGGLLRRLTVGRRRHVGGAAGSGVDSGMNLDTHPIPAERIERRILLVRGQKVLLDRDLAELYGVETRALNQAVRRNIDRFPADFMFALDRDEILRISQFVTSSGTAELKYSKSVLAFTEQGVAMLSGVLGSARAVEVDIAILRTFVQVRQWLSTHADLARKLAGLEQKYDEQFRAVLDAIRELMEPPTPAQQREIGFHTNLPEPASKPRARSRAKVSP